MESGPLVIDHKNIFWPANKMIRGSLKAYKFSNLQHHDFFFVSLT